MNALDEKEQEKILQTIARILSKGNDALVQNRKEGVVVVEQKKTIAYRTELKK